MRAAAPAWPDIRGHSAASRPCSVPPLPPPRLPLSHCRAGGRRAGFPSLNAHCSHGYPLQMAGGGGCRLPGPRAGSRGPELQRRSHSVPADVFVGPRGPRGHPSHGHSVAPVPLEEASVKTRETGVHMPSPHPLHTPSYQRGPLPPDSQSK